MPRRCPACDAETEPLEMETSTGRRTRVLALAAVDPADAGPVIDLATVLSLHAYLCPACGHVELVSARWAGAQGS
jgi:hypothetical protein